MGDVLVKHGSDLVFVVGVLWDHGVDDLVTRHQVTLLHSQLLHLLLLHELLLLEHGLLLHLLGVHLHAHRLTHHWASVHRGVALAGYWALVGVTTVVRTHSLSALGLATLVATGTTLMTAGGARTTNRALLALQKIWHRFDQHLQVELHVLLAGEFSPLALGDVLLSKLLEINFVTGSLVVKLADFFDLRVVDCEGLVIDG